MNNESEANGKFGIGSLFTSVLSGLALTLILFFITAALICFTPLGGGFSETAVLVGTVLGIFASGFLSGAKRSSSGWLWGGIAGVVYALIMFAASAFHGNASLAKLLISAAAAFVCGAAGGILGINLIKNKNS